MYYAATEEKRATKTTLSPAKNAAVGSEA